MAKRKPNSGYSCDTCGKTRKGAHSDTLRNADGSEKLSTSICPECMVDGKSQHYTFEAQITAHGVCEAIMGKCPKHGYIKALYMSRQEPRYQANYSRWLTGEAQAAPKPFREV